MDLYSHPCASLENEFLRVDYLTDIGPRIIGLYAKGAEGNLFAVTPDQHWPTPHGEYYLHGGHRLWTAPEDPFFTCPEDAIKVTHERNKVTIQSDVDASGLEKGISLQLDENCVMLTHRVSWQGKKPIEIAPWAITQLHLGGMVILPLSGSDSGLSPNRNLVFWPYTQVTDERLAIHNDLILVHGRPAKQAFKIGNYNPHGWIAYAMENTLFVKRFSLDSVNRYPDMGCNVEIYVKDTFVELETLGPLTILDPREFVMYEETWELHVGEYPATLETARTIKRQLSQSSMNGVQNGKQNPIS